MPRLWFLNIILHLKEPGLLRDMADFRARSEKVQDEPGISSRPKTKKVLKKKWCRRTQKSLKKALIANLRHSEIKDKKLK